MTRKNISLFSLLCTSVFIFSVLPCKIFPAHGFRVENCFRMVNYLENTFNKRYSDKLRIFRKAKVMPRTRTGTLLVTLTSINRYVNRFRRSMEKPGRDVWLTPEEFIYTQNQIRDCEDFAITKKAMIESRLGYETRLLIGTVKKTNTDHAVLAVKLPDGWFILDNLTDMIVKDKKYKDFYPKIGISRDKVYIYPEKRWYSLN